MKTEIKVNPNETIFFFISLIASVILYYLIINFIFTTLDSDNPAMRSLFVLYFYAIIIIIYLFFRFGLLIGFLKGNAIKLNDKQFPEIYKIVEKQSELLELKKIPKVFILQSGGILNAFATRFLGKNYIVLYSEIVEASIEQDQKMLEFVIAHELGHIKRNHMIKRLLLIPSRIIPFLGPAYSRACEYTCDNIGYSLSPQGAANGLLLLASGRTLFKKINIKEYILQDYFEDGFWKWFAEAVSSHPNLTKRVAVIHSANNLLTANTIEVEKIKKEEDHNRYMPS